MIKLILNYLFLEGDSDFSKIEMIRHAILQDETSSLQLDIQQGIRLIKEYDRIGVIAYADKPSGFQYVVDKDCRQLEIPEAGKVIIMGMMDGLQSGVHGLLLQKRVSNDEAWFDADEVLFPLHIRSRKPGDKIHTVGLNGNKKVKDMFIDLKIPPSQRERIPLILDRAGRVLWIPEIRRSNHALIQSSSRNILHMKIKDT